MSDRYASEQSLHVFLAELFRRMGTAASDGVVHDTVEQHVDLLREQVSSVDETLMVGPGLTHDGSVSSRNGHSHGDGGPGTVAATSRGSCGRISSAAESTGNRPTTPTATGPWRAETPHPCCSYRRLTTTDHQEARMTTPTAIPAHIEVTPGELAHIAGATIVGDSGGHVRITGSVEPSNVLRGMFLVETEGGSLYLDADLPVTIVNPAMPDDADVVDLAQAVGSLRAS